ncbi:hypothetical protein ACVU7I_04415 [Patulibacter sp. S7RM1-6]
MGRSQDKRDFFDALLRVRRIQRELPTSEDVEELRQLLEDRVGDTVSQRFAASVLDVSHTAVARWVRSGDIPAVPTAGGRMEVPVVALTTLAERVASERARGRRHVLEPAVLEARERADRLDPAELIADVPADADPHRRAGRRALAYHRALARLLTEAEVDAARHTLRTWERHGRIDDHYARRWSALLSRPLDDIRAVIAMDTAEARDLRQNSPMAGLLSEPERRKILAAVR